MLRNRLPLSFCLALLAAAPAGAQPFIYGITEGTILTGTNQCRLSPCRGPQLQITNVATGRLLNPDETALGGLGSHFGVAVAMSPDSQRAFVAIRDNTATDRLVIIDAATNEVAADLPVPDGIADLAVSPDSTRVYVASATAHSISLVDPASGAIVGTVTGLLRPPTSLALSPDGARLYVGNASAFELAIVDTAALTVTRVTLPAPAFDVAVSPDGSRVYAATGDAFSISIMDTTTLAITPRSVLPAQPARLALTPDGHRLLMTFHGSSGFGVLDLAADTFAIATAANTAGGALAMQPDGAHVYLRAAQGMLDVDVAAATVVRTLPGGGIDFAVTPPNACLFEVPPQDRWFGRNGGTGTISVPAPAGCSWNVQHPVNAALLTFTAATSGDGPASLTYSVSPQPPGSIDARREIVRIAGQNVSIVETFPRIQIDTPSEGLAGPSFTLAGWAIDIDGTEFEEYWPAFYTNTGPGVDTVHVWAYPDPGSGKAPFFLGAAQYGGERPDVADAFGDQYEPSSFSLDVSGLAPGTYQLIAYARGRCGAFDNHASVIVTVATAAPAMALDTPLNGSTADAPLTISGWAVDRAAASGTGVDAVHVWAFPTDGRAPIFLGAAAYGLNRPDVGLLFGARFAASGFSLTAAGLPTGAYHITASAHSSVQHAFTAVRSAAVTVLSSRVVIDTPQPGFSGPQPLRIAGWAADFAATSGAGIDAIHVWAYPSNGGAPIFAGVAQIGIARPDVAAVYGGALANAGYQIDVTGLPAGTYTFVVWAHSAVTGRFERCATVTVTITITTG
jgi:DNA-binding beta-propeller fold protein YncE